MKAEIGKLYFINDNYKDIINIQDAKNISMNKTREDGFGKRPYLCVGLINSKFYVFVPITSQVAKFEKREIFNVNHDYSNDGFAFIGLNGKKRVALLQNMIPITEEFIDNKYVSLKGFDRGIREKSKSFIISQAFSLLDKQRHNKPTPCMTRFYEMIKDIEKYELSKELNMYVEDTLNL